jgi:type IV pilus assembly protein PilF
MFKQLILLLLLCLTACSSTNNTQAAQTHMQIGLHYLETKHYPEAQQELLLALKQNPHDVNTLNALAYYYEITQQPTIAGKYYQRALAESPSDPTALSNNGTFLCRTHHFTEAKKYLLQAAENTQYAHRANAYANLGTCTLMEHNPTAAISYFKKALALDPQLVQAQQKLTSLETKNS